MEDREKILFGLVSNPLNLAWEVWREDQLVGVILLTDISPLVDARLHFAFFDHKLVSKTTLLNRFLAYCFHDLRFQRISVQVPEFFGTLLSYYQKKLKFRFEGETNLENHQMVGALDRVLAMLSRIDVLPTAELESVLRGLSGRGTPRKTAHVWMASRGSRREQAHWQEEEQKWCDVFCLRLLASEFDSLGVLCRSSIIPMVAGPTTASPLRSTPPAFSHPRKGITASHLASLKG